MEKEFIPYEIISALKELIFNKPLGFSLILEINNMSTEEFIDKIDELCFEHGFEIWPTETINKRNEDGSYPTFTVHNIETGEKVSLIYIDGDGRGN